MSDQAPSTKPFELFDHIQAVGYVSLIWSNLDVRMNNAIWELADLSPTTGACLTSQLPGTGQRVQCLMALLKHRNAPKSLIDGFNSLAGAIDAAGRKRSKLVQHELEIFRSVNVDLRIGFEFEAMPTGDFSVELTGWHELAATITNLIKRFDGIFSRVDARLRSPS